MNRNEVANSIMQDLQTLIETAQSGNPLPTELLQKFSTLDTSQLLDAIIRNAVLTNPQNYSSSNNYILSQIRLAAVNRGKVLTLDQEIDLVIKIKSGEIASLHDELSSSKYANITPEKNDSQPRRNSSDRDGR